MISLHYYLIRLYRIKILISFYTLETFDMQSGWRWTGFAATIATLRRGRRRNRSRSPNVDTFIAVVARFKVRRDDKFVVRCTLRCRYMINSLIHYLFFSWKAVRDMQLYQRTGGASPRTTGSEPIDVSGVDDGHVYAASCGIEFSRRTATRCDEEIRRYGSHPVLYFLIELSIANSSSPHFFVTGC